MVTGAVPKDEPDSGNDPPAVALGRKGGLKGREGPRGEDDKGSTERLRQEGGGAVARIELIIDARPQGTRAHAKGDGDLSHCLALGATLTIQDVGNCWLAHANSVCQRLLRHAE